MIRKVFGTCLAFTLTIAFASCVFANNDDYQKASELLEKKSYQEAIPYLDKAISADSKHSEAYLDRALCNFHLGKYKEALADCNAVESHNAHEITKRQAYMMSAGAHNALGEYADAVQSADKAIALAPHASLCYSDRAFANKQLKKFDEALHDVNEAIKLDPKHASNFEMRASIYEIMSRQDRQKYRELIQGRKPGEKPWEKMLKPADKT